MPLKTHVAAPGSINSERLTAKPAREGFVRMCACTEPVRIGIGVVCVDSGGLKWPITILNYTPTKTHTYRENKKGTLHASHDPLCRDFFLGKPR